jgi:hypothetical protein
MLTSVMPTVLHALGVPLAEDLAGPVERPLFASAFLSRHPVRHVSTYGPRARPERPKGRPLDQEMIDRMKSLGYLR